MMKRIFIFLFLFIGIQLFSQTAIPPSGSGTEGDPYQIASLENLYWIAAEDSVVSVPNQESRWSSYYIQTADIDASETISWFDGAGWIPIGKSYALYFSGSYDGQDHTINGIYINRPEMDNIGLFGFVRNAIGISNVVLLNIEVTGGIIVGTLAGQIEYSQISNCSSIGTVSGEHSVGGLYGGGSNALIENCNFTGLFVEGNEFVGGLVGYISFDTIINSYSSAVVTGEKYIGGLVGYGFFSELSDCYSSGSINGDLQVGGLIGQFLSSTLSNSYFSGNIDANFIIGGIVGEIQLSTVSNSFYNYENTYINGEHIISIGALDDDLYNTWQDNDLTLNIDDYLSFDGENYLITGLEDFKKLLAFGQYPQYSFKLINNIDLSGHFNFFIPYFSGDFDGNEQEINNLNIETDNVGNTGLFGFVVGSTIENLSVINIDINGQFRVGGIAGEINNGSTIANCHTTGLVSGYGMIGGLAGVSHNSIITNSSSIGRRDGISMIGGLVGSQKEDSMITYSFSSGVVEGTVARIGGLVGNNYESSIEYSFSNCNVIGRSDVGGIVGNNTGHPIGHVYNIRYCYNTGSVHGDHSMVGGLVGYNSDFIIENSFNTGNVTGGMWCAGGLVGSNDAGSIIKKSYNIGNVMGNEYSGGLIGYNSGTVMDCYSTGSVSGYLYVGGLIGEVSDESDINNCYSIGEVNGVFNDGGLIGHNFHSTVNNSYWDVETSGCGYSAGGEGRTTDEMTFPHAANTYVNWDFNQIWRMDENYSTNDGYPYLAWHYPLPAPNINVAQEVINLESYWGQIVSANLTITNDGNEDLIILIEAIIDDLIVDMIDGTVFPGETDNFEITIDTSNYEPTLISGIINIHHNATNQNNPIYIPIHIDVFPLPLPIELEICENSAFLTWKDPEYSEIELIEYQVYLDDELIGETNETEFQFDTDELVFGEQYTAGVVAVYDVGESEMASIDFEYQGTGSEELLISVTQLHGNYPNPFNPETKIEFSLRKPSRVQIYVYNIKGQKVKTLLDEKLDVARHSIIWDGRDDRGDAQSSGVYLYEMITDDYSEVKKMLLIK